MADNVAVTAGSGTTVAADEVVDGTLGTVKVQFTKLMDGTLDSTNKAVVSASGALKVDGSAVTQPVSGTVTATLGSTQNTNLANIDSATSRLTSSATNIVAGSALATTSFVIGSRYLSTPPTFANGQEGALQISSAGRLLTDANATLSAETTKVIGVVRTADGSGNLLTSTANALDINIKSGANANGQAVMASSAPVVIASNQSAIPVNPAAAATGGATNLHFFSVATAPAAVAIKASAGTLYGVQAVNTGAAPVYLKLYNVAAASVTVGTTVPLMTIPVPNISTTGAGIAISFPVGVAFGTAISYTFTNVAADNDATAVAVGTTLNVQFA